MRSFLDSIKDTIYGEQISNNMWRDNNGQLICENVVLARTGFYEYRESELFEGGSPEKIVKVYRSPEEVFNPISMKSMNYKPLVDDHPEDNVTPDTVGTLQKGFMTNIRKGVGEFDECLMADIIATDPYVIDEILSNKKRDLSVGYTADIEEVDGKYFMKNIRGNHIALCDVGRAGNARIRDSISANDAEDVYYASVEEHSGHSEYMTSNDSKTGDRIVSEAVRSSGVKEKKRWFKTFFVGTRSQVQNFVRACGRLDDHLFIVSGPEKASEQFLKQLGDSTFVDFEAKGSFRNAKELEEYYPGCTTEARSNGLVVRLKSGVKLLYAFIGGNGQLAFIRRVTDSIRDGVEVLGDATKLCVGQRAEYCGSPCIVTEIAPNRALNEFLVSFGAEGITVGRHSYAEVMTLLNQGKIKLLDSVVFDSITDSFKFEKTDDYSDSFNDNYSDCFTDSKYKAGDKVRPRDGGDVEVIEKIIEEDTAGHDRSGKKVTKYLMKSGRKYLAEDLEGSAWKRVSDSGANLKSFRVSVGGKKFDTRATSAAHAVDKVREAVADAMPKNYVMYRPSTKSYLQVGSSIMGGTVYEGPSVSSAARYDKIPASVLVGDLNRLMTKLGHKADWVTKEITEKDLGL